ncbi:hypothetical protein ELH21_07350 [Rhizobium leguminosarum]|uniref:hypothetical protein n=1 Tax=Rhizobium leguminosarum TaxID=384 RepID=UPI00102FB820|nr:hypothetical protein [Rhizobium leguminosarum]TBD04226.1 hypothetical protein ELH21_07350 [Rhizobium leguminosarum]
MTDELKTIKFQMMLSESEAKAIDDWSFANRIRSRAEAIRRLCQMAIQVDPVFLDLMIKLVVAANQGKGSRENEELHRAATEAHAAWSLLRKGESLEQAQGALDLVKEFLRSKHEQEK